MQREESQTSNEKAWVRAISFLRRLAARWRIVSHRPTHADSPSAKRATTSAFVSRSTVKARMAGRSSVNYNSLSYMP